MRTPDKVDEVLVQIEQHYREPREDAVRRLHKFAALRFIPVSEAVELLHHAFELQATLNWSRSVAPKAPQTLDDILGD